MAPRPVFLKLVVFAGTLASIGSSVSVGQPRAEPSPAVRAATRDVTVPSPSGGESREPPSEQGRDDRLEGPGAATDGPTFHESRTSSVGSTSRGRLLRGVRLGPTPHLRVRNPSQAFGTVELVALVTWAAEQVAGEHPGASLNVGDLSRERGGRLRPHRSHRVGRDVDLGFYLRDATTGEAAESRHFVALPRGGEGTDRSGATFTFDDARNWTLIAALVGQDVVPVQYVMVIAPLKERLLAEGRRRGASEELLARVDAVVGPQRTGRGRFARYGTHDSHFHVRVYCAPDDRPRCVDAAPFHPWVRQATVRQATVRSAAPRATPTRARRTARRALARLL